jgi:spermidine synthase
MLYTLNTLGGVAGAAAAGWLLLPAVGLRATTFVAAAVNGLVGLAAIRAARGTPADPPATASTVPDAPGWIFPAYAVSGFAALACEMAWTRGLVLALGSSVYSFSLTLASFILGLGLGGAAGTLGARRLKDSVLVFAVLQAGVAVCTVATIPILERLPLVMMDVVASAKGFGAVMTVQAGLAALVVALPAFLMGAMFPFLCSLALGSREAIGAAVGRLYSWNTIGAILGALAGSFLLLPWFGIPGTLLAAAALNVSVSAFALLRRPTGGKAAPALVLAGGILVVLVTPGWDLALVSTTPVLYGERFINESKLYARPLVDILRDSNRNRIIYSRWDSCGLVTVHQTGKLRTLRINGKADASTEDDMATQILTAHLPLLMHAAPKDALVIGLGSGATAAAALRHPVRSVDVVELLPAVVEASQFFDEALGPWRSDPRVKVSVSDARTHARFTPRRYDVVAAEPSNLWLSGMATLFTREQFQRYRDLLNPGGIVCQWVHAYRLPRADFAAVLATFRSVFPESSLWEVSIGGDYLLVGTTGGTVGFEEFRRRFGAAAVSEELRRWGLPSSEALLRHWIGGPAMVEGVSRGAREITDDDCHVEYSAPRGLVQDSRTEILEALDPFRETSRETLAGAPDPASGRWGRRLLASAVKAVGREGAVRAIELLEGSMALNSGDPALPFVLDGITRRAYHHAANLYRRGNLEGARALFDRIPKESPVYPEAQKQVRRLSGN